MDARAKATLLRNRWKQMMHEATAAGIDPLTTQTALAALVAEWLADQPADAAAAWLAQVGTWSAESRKRLAN